MSRCQTFLLVLLSAIAGLTSGINTVEARSNYDPCQPPSAGEYLLLVATDTLESQEQVQLTLPANTNATLCLYLDDIVTRIGGFASLDDTNNWARYLIEIGGLEAFVVRPPQVPEGDLPAYNPQPLGNGFAVLVDYFNQPELAAEVRDLLETDVGLASFGQRPYLLAIHTTNRQEANSTLQKLSDRGFWAAMVDSRQVIVLSSVVNYSW